MFKFNKKYTFEVVLSLLTINLIFTVFLLLKANHDSINFEEISDPSTYQAVFLDNDQIYFGHLESFGRDYVRLKDVYYVRVNENGGGQLVKLGQTEPHRPINEMIINRKNILFWENLVPDSPIIRTIQNDNT